METANDLSEKLIRGQKSILPENLRLARPVPGRMIQSRETGTVAAIQVTVNHSI